MNRSLARTGIVAALLVSAVLASVAVGCSAPAPSEQPAASASVKVTEAANGTTINLGAGQELVVELPGNPSTGYTWVVTALPSVLTTVGEPQFASDPNAAAGAVGAGGTISTTFRAGSAGTGKLEMGYERPWETVPAEKTFTADIVVK